MIKSIKEAKVIGIKTYLIIGFLSLLIGLVVGTVDFIFGIVLLELGSFRTDHLLYLLPFLAPIGLIIVYLYKHYGKKASKGMALLFLIDQKEEKELPLILIPLVIVTTWLTHLFGGSAGREGVAVQIGATISHYFHSFVRVENASKIFLVVGMSAGFAGLFQTPMAAVLFALEVLVLDHMVFIALVPAVLAAFTSSMTTQALGLEKFSISLTGQLSMTPLLLLKFLLLGIVFGLVGNLFAISLSALKTLFADKVRNAYWRIACIGLIISLAILLLHQGRYSGLGTNLIASVFSHQEVYSYDWLLKLIFTVLTIAAGYQGGEVTPLFAIGASLGCVLAPILGLPVLLCAALGYCAVFASATNTFLTPVFIGLEVFGGSQTSAFFLVVAISYMLNRKASIYPFQKIAESRE
ncbi:chloride channel protein [Streptococcus catagoni]|uniref:chloride channel protein n=1 Tax=Streptococcus catagoni TaxID=2654874 RepID=UPI00140DFB8E|nr:chloride channel protein [Streptococcus catagoni]